MHPNKKYRFKRDIIENRESIMKAIELLPKKHIDVAKMIFLEGLSQRDVAKKSNFSQGGIGHIIKKTKLLLKDFIEEQGSIKLTESQSKKAADYLFYVKKLIKIYSRSRIDEDTLESNCMHTLVIAARDYRENSTITFATYTKFRIMKTITETRTFSSVNGFKPLTGFRMQELTYEKNERYEQQLEDKESVYKMLLTLPKRYASAVKMVVMEGQTYGMAAKNLSCSPSEIGRRINISLDILSLQK